MANFIRQIVGGGVSFASQAIGWEAPTSQAPAFASFFDGSSSNLASGGLSSNIGAPVFVPGSTSDIPYMNVQNYTYGVNTGVAAPPNISIVALYRMGVPSNMTSEIQGNIVSNFTGNFTSQDPVQLIAQAFSPTNSTIKTFANTPAGGILNNISNTGSFSTWQVIVTRINRNQLAQTITSQNLTTGQTEFASVANTSPLTGNGGNLLIGTDTSGGSSISGVGNFGFVGIWPSIITDADGLSMYSTLQKRCARYNVTV